MRIISDITGQEYKTVELCLAAEEQFLKDKAEKEKAAKELEAKKEEAYKKAIAACDEYLKLCGIEAEFTDNGYKIHYHTDSKADKIFEDILNAWFN